MTPNASSTMAPTAAAATTRGGATPGMAVVIFDLFLAATSGTGDALYTTVLTFAVLGLAVALFAVGLKLARHRYLLTKLAQRVGLLERGAGIYVICGNDREWREPRGDGTCSAKDEFEWAVGGEG